jgi:twinfilin-like protein
MQLIIDQKGERIMLEKCCDKLDVASLPSHIPLASARFHLYRFSHLFDDLPHKSLVFIHSISELACPVKERMIYSSCKSELLSFLKAQHICPIKALEISDPSELSRQSLTEQIHPKKWVIASRDGSGDAATSSRDV